MSTHNQPKTENWLDIFTVVGILVTGVFVLAVGLLALQTETIQSFFALDSVHIWWYSTSPV